MMNYRLSYNGLSGFDYTGFDTEEAALMWAAHQERLQLIKALQLMKYNVQQDRYDIIEDLSGKTVEINLPNAGHNKTFSLTYIQNKTYYEILVEAPAVKTAEVYFKSKKPSARSISAREAFPEDMKPGIPVLCLTEKEERLIRDDFLFSDLEELDLSVRTYNSLRRAGIDKVWQLVCKSENELKKIHNLGWKGLEEIKTVLNDHGEALAPLDAPQVEQNRKASLASQIRSVAHYAENESIKEAVLESDVLRNKTLNACYDIPGYEKLSREDKNKLYDLVKKSISLCMEQEKKLAGVVAPER